jgi:tubulin polyglutamylase TTLL6/13
LNEPFLIDNLKFDLRIYVLLTGVNPLRIYIFADGLVRFATTPYQPAKKDNLGDLFMHLTNYAINKKSKDYVRDNNNPTTGFSNANEKQFADESAHKRSLKSLYCLLTKMGYDVYNLQKEIDDIVIKTVITSQPSLNHIYKSCQPEDVDNAHCF